MTTAAGADRPKRFTLDSRYIAPILISCILLAGQLSFGILESYPKTLLAIGASILTEIVLSLLIVRKFPHLASAYVTGISIGILIRSPEWWPYALAAMIAITSKYVVRVNGRHLWNPSNLAIVTLLLFAPQTVASLSIQWGNSVWPMLVVWVLGSIIIYRLKRFHICATYVLSFIAYAFLRAAVNLDHSTVPLMNRFFSEVAPITGPMYQLFIFFMITDPRTTTHTRWGQNLVAFLVATVESALRQFAPPHFAVHAPYYALTLMGPSSNLIEIALQARKKQREKAAGTPSSVTAPAR